MFHIVKSGSVMTMIAVRTLLIKHCTQKLCNYTIKYKENKFCKQIIWLHIITGYSIGF